LNLPKPEKFTSLPRLSVSSMVVSTASTALVASPFDRPDVDATWSTNSDFVTAFLLQFWTARDTNSALRHSRRAPASIFALCGFPAGLRGIMPDAADAGPREGAHDRRRRQNTRVPLSRIAWLTT